jgi:5-methyltetrahydropteroyltriglutamate--homocysteine methyltransferase
VGSLPLTDDFEGLQENFKRAVRDKLSSGLDFPCYPQLPGTKESPMNMYLQFLEPLVRESRGLSIEGEEICLVGEIEIPDRPVGVERARYFIDYISKNLLTDVSLGSKACVTGPFTLASSIDREDIFKSGVSKKEVILRLSELVSISCSELERLGFDLINIDEPILSVILAEDQVLKGFFGYGIDFVIDILNGILNSVRVYTGIHVCGIVTPIVKHVLLESEVDIVDHEFCDIPQNIQAYSKRELESGDKLLGFGCVSTTNSTVETVETIKLRIRQGMQIFGDNILIKPDCGFGGLLGLPSAYEISLRKLKNMVQVRKALKKEMDGF